jgi:hypothetical protein
MHPLRILSSLRLGLLAGVISCAALAQSVDRLPRPPPELGTRNSWTPISPSAFYEVQASRAEEAAEWLRKADLLVLKKERDTDTYFSQADQECRSPQILLLVRATYINGATGAFRLYWAGESLVIAHDFLGPQTIVHQTALVACLPRLPSNVYEIMPGAL